METRADHFPLFDSLRGIAAFAVIWAHAASFGGMIPAGSWIEPYVGQLPVAVPMFMVVSGFLLYRPFVAARLREEAQPSLLAYGWRRLLRLIPAYWVALTLITLWLGSSPHIRSGIQPTEVFSGEGILAYYGLAQTYSAATVAGGLPQAWTLNVEAIYYVFLPVFVVFMAWWAPRRGRRATVARELLAVGAMIAASTAYTVIATLSSDKAGAGTVPLLSWFPAHLDHLALGMGLAVLSAAAQQSGRQSRAERLLDHWPAAAWGVAALAFWIVSTQIGLTGAPFEEADLAQVLARHSLFGVIAVALALPAVFGDPRRGLVRKLMGNRAVLHFGMTSYGIYLWHVAIIIQLQQWGWGDNAVIHPYVHWVIPVVLLAWLAGSASYYVVERPAMKLKRLVGGRRGAGDQPGAVSTPVAPRVS